MAVQLCRMPFINKNIAPEEWILPLTSISSVGTPLFISFLGVYIYLITNTLQVLLPKSKCSFYLDGMTLTEI